MPKVKQLLRLLITNVFVLIGTLFIINLISAFILKQSSFSTPSEKDPRVKVLQSQVASLKEDIDAEIYFKNFNSLKTTYKSFVGWKRQAYASKYININQEGLRSTYDGGGEDREEIWCFGGSTMWGVGAGDDFTIPSLIAKALPEFRVINFAETGFKARSSLEVLENLYSQGRRAKWVLFLDGVNEVEHYCSGGKAALSHSREVEIRNRMRKSGKPLNLKRALGFTLVGYTRQLVRRYTQKPNSSGQFKSYSCNPSEYPEIINTLTNTWAMAQDLVEARNGNFVAFLQPNAFFYPPKEEALELIYLNSSLRRPMKDVYAKLEELFNAEDSKRCSLAKIFGGSKEAVYLDFCHLNSNGNQTLVDEMLRIMEGESGLNPTQQGG